jgi:hypothetical protein
MKRFYIFLAVAALCLVPASVQGATVLVSENFDELTTMLSVTSVGAFSTIDGTNVDIFRAVPVPRDFLETLDAVHGLDALGDARALVEDNGAASS